MLYAFIDRIEVHEATGGRTIYRQQNIDIHFNFIGNYYPPVETVSEEERIAAIEAEQLRKKQEKANARKNAESKSCVMREAARRRPGLLSHSMKNIWHISVSGIRSTARSKGSQRSQPGIYQSVRGKRAHQA